MINAILSAQLAETLSTHTAGGQFYLNFHISHIYWKAAILQTDQLSRRWMWTMTDELISITINKHSLRVIFFVLSQRNKMLNDQIFMKLHNDKS